MRGTITRLSKLEAKRAPRAEALFYVFGMDEDDAAERLAVEIRAGTVNRGDACRTPIWRGAAPPPPPRWASPSDLTAAELEDAIADLARQLGRKQHPRGFGDQAVAEELSAIQREIAAESGLLVWR
ncbi:hypothetical protein [Methylobacterium trifolii]|uniref:Uncharacterized protein n=1 Tax=Methylobacterium trifolii TaxID=1003092 RepID=A0ABQ4TV36_9HYPH|nr:hypothetical protein [Methylobacterium trifolii]GJE59095.1 hypothetical protein MPOCJGCO_1182 [Methylobacterium trifolii]